MNGGFLKMLIVAVAGLSMIALTTVVQQEFLRLLSSRLPLLNMPGRSKLLVVVYVTFNAHIIEREHPLSL